MNNDFIIYQKEIEQYPILSNDEILKLFVLYKQGDMAAKDKIVLSHLRLVISIAKKHVSNENKIEDLIQEGNIGLLKAVDKFDQNKNDSFSLYAIYWIQKYIYEYIQDNKFINVPSKIEKLNNEIDKLIEEDENISDVQICDRLNINYKQFVNARRFKYHRIQLDDLSQVKLIEDDYLIKNVLNDLLENIKDDKDKLIVKLYLGLNGEKEMSFEQIGKIFNISKVAVYKRYNKVIEKLRKEYVE